MTNQHTSGPWTIEQAGGVLSVGASGAGNIAHVLRSVMIDDSTANARLIAAAPELLAAAELALKTLENMTTDDFSKGGDKAARDALLSACLKATGHET